MKIRGQRVYSLSERIERNSIPVPECGGMMAEYEKNKESSDEWYTPPEIFKQMGVTFDLDPCSPGVGHWVPARKVFTITDDGLSKDWEGFVYMNPPYGGRNSHLTWLDKFIDHGNGIAVVRAYTSSKWFHDYINNFHALNFPRGKTKFIRPDGSIGKSPGHGIVLLAIGENGVQAISRIDGLFIKLTDNIYRR